MQQQQQQAAAAAAAAQGPSWHTPQAGGGGAFNGAMQLGATTNSPATTDNSFKTQLPPMGTDGKHANNAVLTC